MGILRDKVWFTIALGHMTVDFLSGQRVVILTYVVALLGLSNAALGFLMMVYTVLASVVQPLFGYLSDRFGARLMVTAGLVWIAVCYTLGTLVPGTLGMGLFVLASLGSGCFHPGATMVSTHRGRDTTAMALFFLFGQAGLFLAPLVGGLVLERTSMQGMAVMGLLAMPVALLSMLQLRDYSDQSASRRLAPEKGSRSVEPAARRGLGQPWWVLAAFLTVVAFQCWVQQNMVSYVPKYLNDLGQSPATYGFLASLFMGGSAIGNVAGGFLADRLGKRTVIVVMLSLASLPIALVAVVGWSSWLYVLLPLAGALTGATFSILIVLAQRLIPLGLAMASGLALGYHLTSGSVGSYLSGYMIDWYGFAPMFYFTAAMSLAAGLLALVIRKPQSQAQWSRADETPVAAVRKA